MEHPIVGFDQDELGDWRATLACGHRLHVRHNPPFVERPWVLTEEGRRRFLGATVDCKACDEGEPANDTMISASALENIYGQFHNDLHRFILRQVPDPDAAEDIQQDVYLQIHAHVDELRGGDRLESWLYQTIRNVIFDHYRRIRTRMELHEHLELPENNDRDTAEQLVPSVKAMLACLPGKYRQALILAEYQGLGLHEIAHRLDISPSEARSLVQRGREKLREALLDCCHFEFESRGRAIGYQPHCAACAADNADL